MTNKSRIEQMKTAASLWPSKLIQYMHHAFGVRLRKLLNCVTLLSSFSDPYSLNPDPAKNLNLDPDPEDP